MALTTMGATVGADGISIPSYADVLLYLQNKYKSIFGGDSYIDPDSQDGQLMAEFAKAIYDTQQHVLGAA